MTDSETDGDYFDGFDLEEDLNEAYLAMLCERGTPHAFKKQSYLYHQGDEAPTVYVLISGTVKATCSDEYGHEALLKIHGPGSFLGLSALRRNPIRDASAMALDPLETVVFRREEFFALMNEDGQLGVLLVQLLLKRQQQLHARVSEMTGHRVDQRLARVLLQLAAEKGKDASLDGKTEIPITHEELATLVLSRRQYVTAILRTFVSNDLIQNRRGVIEIVDFDGLRDVEHGVGGTALTPK